ncbi:FlgD immunoglobulin-like domain containing protein [Microbulbifer sp. 2201CG32-9]|uniref:FlgD immunoglobulin-like domain containing protein n=1 Tax=Microbulbifer sp. 2201CG32-9 TaxID=3232309 RepID=UPI00345C60DB
MSRQKIQDVQDPIAGGINSRLKKRKKPTPMLNRQVVAIILLFFAQIFSQAAAAEDIVLYPLPEKHYQPSLYVTGLASLSREILQAEVNGELVAETLSNETGDFALRIPLQAGDNQLRIIGTTAQSAIHTIGYLPTAAGSGIWKVTGTSEAPDFPSLDPLPATTSDNPTTVTGTAPPETSVSFFVNGRYTRSIDIDASGVFSTWVPLEDNANSIYAIAENENGQSPASNTINTEYGNSTQREWSGTLSETLVWTPGDGTPYQLIGNLTIAEGATLWLQPGTRVDIAADYKLLVQGELVVAGDEASPVVLKPTAAACDGTNTWRQDWRGIEVLAAASASIEYAEIHCASKGVHFNGGDGAIRHTRLLNNHAAVEMIATSPETAIAPELLANEIRGGFYGISVQRNSAPLIGGGNEITRNYYGLYATGNNNQAQNPAPVVTGNSIDANTGYNYYASSFGNAALTVLDATDNWWGTTNPAQIAAKIYDWSDSPTSAPVVNYSGYLDGVAGEPVYSGEFLNGPIAADTTLSASEYQIQGNVTIAQGTTLTIDPSTQLNIAVNAKLQVQGALLIAGSGESPVVFKPTAAACDGTNTWRQDWRGIEVLAAASASIEYAEIHCASKGVHFNGGDGAIRHTRLLNNHAAVEMIATSPETAIAPELLANEIRGGFYGISVQRNSAPLIGGGNEITGNYYGLYATGNNNQAQNPAPVVTGNSIDANTGYNYYASSFGNAALTVLDATDNWWGTTNPAQIAAKIYDWSDSPTSAPVVNYSGYLDGVAGEPVYSGEFLNGPIAADTTLSAGEYQIQGNVTIAQGTTLTIDPATQLNIAVNAKLQVQGALLIAGSGESPVVFKPTAAACDGTNTQRQDWRGIEVLAAASASIEYAEIHCASKGVHFNGGDGAIRHTRLLNNHAAVEMIATSPETAIAPELLANEIRGSFFGISVQRNSAPLISGDNEITGNYYGLYATGNNNQAQNPAPVVTGNSIYANTSHNYNAGSFGNPALAVLDAKGNWWGSADPAKIIITIYDHKNSSSSPFVNYANYLAAPGGQPAYDGQTLLGPISEDLTLPSGDHRMLQNIVVEPGVTLTLQPGASLKSAPDFKLQIAGNLVARGITGERVEFSSASPTPQSGDWYGIEVVTGGIVDLDYARIEGAVYGLDFNGGQGTVRNSLFRFNTHGIYIRANSDPLITDGNEITLNDYGVYIIGNGVPKDNPMPVITGNNLYGNSSYDLYTTGFGDPQSVTLDITGNWWGTADPAAIEARIYTAAASSPQVDFSNYLEAVIGLPAVTISGVSLHSPVLHPLAGESAQGLFTLNRAATVTVEIRRESDNTVVNQASESHPAAGDYPLLWDGRDNQGTLMPEDLYRVVLLANDGVDDFVYDAPNPSGAGSVSGAVPSRYNAYANDFYKISVNVASPSLVSMQVTPDGGPAFYVFKEAFYPEGQHWLYWDGRDPNGDIIDVPVSVFYPAPLRVRPTAIYVAAAAPDITGPGAAPNIEVKSDPYLVSHSYEQLTRMAYRISNDAHVTFSLLPPGIVDPQDPSAIVLVDNVLQQAQDGSGEPIQHEVEWRGYDLADPNAVLVGEEGAYTFAIQARSAETGESTLYRGVVNLYR